ncbi:TPA: hypothetical protein OUD13_002424 [Morganella morganii]|nr:hypothetical protein [Morganella morganii]
MKNPKLIVKPFAKNGQKNVIPENYETSMESNQATWDQGFGQITMLPVAAGGLPPKGQDFNGIFNQISENIVYLSQGGRFKFSAEYAESIGGYPKGAILQSDDEKKEYLSLIDNNKVDFNTATDINASWKLVNTDDLLAQIDSKQPKGDYATKTELNSGLAGKQPVGDYATKTEVNSKLAKAQNGADIPDKPKFIENLGLPELLDKKFDKTGGVITASGAAVDIRTKSDSSGYFQISDTSGKAMHQIGKTTAGAELIIRNVTEEATVSIGKQGVKFNGSLLGIINTAFNGNNGGGWWRCGTTGVIIQWGRTPTGATSRPINFPIPFTDAGYVVNHFDGGFRDNTRWGTSDRTKTGFIAMCNDASQGGNYIAIGF